MAFPTDIATQADVDVFQPDIWGERINDFLKKKLVMGSFFTNRSAELASGGRDLFTPGLTEMTAAAKSNGAAVTLNSPTETKKTLTVDQWYEVSFVIEDAEAAQVKRSYTLLERYAKNAAYTVASRLDTAIATLFSGFSNVVGASTTAVVDSDIRKAIGILEGSNVDIDECAMFFDSKVFWNQVLGLTNFTLAANAAVAGYTPLEGLKMEGRIYGVPVFRSNNIQYVSGSTGRNNAIAHPDAIHWATSPLGAGGSKGSGSGSMGVRVQSNYVPEYLGTLVTADILYGVVENRDEAGVLFRTSAA